MKSKLIIILLFCVLTTNIAAQARGRMVVVPFSGGGNYGDFLSQYILVRTTLRTWDTVQPSQSVTDNLSRELNYFPRNGMMNINYLAALTGFYNARYAMTGNIYRIRNNTVFVISIIDTETRRLAAAEILSFENSSDGTPLRSDVDAVLPRTVDALLNGLRTNTSALPVLAVNRTATGDDIVDLLSHLLIVNLHKTGEYSISIQPTEREQRSINNILHFEVWDFIQSMTFSIVDQNNDVLRLGSQAVDLHGITLDTLPLLESVAMELSGRALRDRAQNARAQDRARLQTEDTENQSRIAGELEQMRERENAMREAGESGRIAMEEAERLAAEAALQREREMQERVDRLAPIIATVMFDEGKRLFSVGLNIGSAVIATPVLMINFNITFTLGPYWFIETGLDFGMFHGSADYSEAHPIKGVEYHSWYFYGRGNFFLPFERPSNGGWYIGIGAGNKNSTYSYSDPRGPGDVVIDTPAIDFATGILFGRSRVLFRVGYSLRINMSFTAFNHRGMVGVTTRLGPVHSTTQRVSGTEEE